MVAQGVDVEEVADVDVFETELVHLAAWSRAVVGAVAQRVVVDLEMEKSGERWLGEARVFREWLRSAAAVISKRCKAVMLINAEIWRIIRSSLIKLHYS